MKAVSTLKLQVLLLKQHQFLSGFIQQPGMLLGQRQVQRMFNGLGFMCPAAFADFLGKADA